MGMQLEIKDMCTNEDVQTIKIGEPIESFGDTRSSRDPFCDTLTVSNIDCIQVLGPIYDGSGTEIINLEYKTKYLDLTGTVRGGAKGS